MADNKSNEPQINKHPKRWKIAVMVWLAIYPLITLLLFLFGDQFIKITPLPLRTFVITIIVVPLMVYIMEPLLQKVLSGWLKRKERETMEDRIYVGEHPQLEALPDWPTRTIGVLVTLDQGPYAIPVSAPQRAGDRRILLSLRRNRGSLARLRKQSQVALALLTEGNIAFTARGRARIVQEPLADAPDYAAVAIEVECIDDHRQAEFLVESGIDRRWVDKNDVCLLPS